MIKKVFKFSILTLMIICASVFCMVISNNQVKIVNADEVNQTVNLSYMATSTDFVKGTVEGYGEYPVGSNVTLTATPNAGCYFVKWKIWDEKTLEYIDLLDENNNVITQNPYSFVIKEDTKIQAEFDFVEYQITDTLTNFIINDLSFEPDSERFNEDNLTSYPRAEVVTNKINGSFYYNDIVTLNYSLSSSANFVKEFTSSNFIMNKRVMLISVDTDGNILWTETGGNKDNSLQGQPISTHEYDFDNYDYVVVTNINAGSKYIASQLTFKTKITKNLNIIVTENSLKLITMTALLDENGTKKIEDAVSLDMAEIEDAVSFDYGYYAKLTDLSVISEPDSTKRYYLVESNANYKLTLSDNSNYIYIQTNSSTENVIQGYFDSSIIGFTFLYQRRGYQINFTQIVKTETGYENADANWSNLTSFSSYSGTKIKVEYSDNQFIIYINEESTYTINPLTDVYGFQFYGFSNTNTLDEENTTIEYTIDATNPVGTTIYVVLTKIKYNFTFGVADTSEEFNKYFDTRVINLPADGQQFSRLDQINLTANVPTGFNTIKWILKHDNQVVELTQTSFSFKPLSNNENVEVLLVIEYKYLEFSLSLDGFDDLGNNVADINISVVEYFVITDDNTLELHGKYFNHTGTDDFEFDFTKDDKYTELNQIKFTSSIGNVLVYLNGEAYDYLIFNGLTYLYSGSDFRRFSESSRTTLDYTTETIDSYKIKLTNVCIDDFIFVSSIMKEDYSEEFQFLSFVKFVKEGSINRLPDTRTLNAPIYYGSNYYVTTNIIAKYIKQNGLISVMSGNEKAFYTSKLEFDYIGTLYDTGDTYVSLEIRTDENVSVMIKKSEITPGYSFAGVDVLMNTGVVTSLWQNSSNLSDNGTYYIFKFKFSSTYRNSRITVNFQEITYTVNINTTASIAVVDNENNNLLVDNTFNINWSIIETEPKFTVISTQGYYISNAYFMTEENSVRDLIGGETEQTNKSKIFTVEELSTIIKLADTTNNITLYLVEEERLFNITVQYVAPESVNGFYYKDAVTTCIYDTEEGTETITKTAEIRIGQSSTIFCLTFNSIKFNTVINLSLDDSNIEGLYFSNWTLNDENKNDTDYQFTLTDDVYIYANFEALYYNITFNYLNSDLTKSEDITSGASFTVENIPATSFIIGNQINIKIVEKTGYELIDAYYEFGANDISIFNQLTNDLHYSIDQFMPNEYLISTRDEQISSNFAKNLVINLVFEEKIYSIFGLVVNDTRQSANSTIKVSNLTNKPVGEWFYSENLTKKYSENGQDIIISADPDNFVNCKTNSDIEISFNNTLSGISLKSIYLGSNKYTINNIGEIDIAGQVVTLSQETKDNLEYYVLKFNLNSELLESTDNKSNFEISFVYEMKKYLLTLTTETFNDELLAKTYSLKLSYSPADERLPLPTSSGVGQKWQNAKNINNSTLFYGLKNTWTITYDPSTSKDFDKKYSFAYFTYKNGDQEIMSFVPEETTGNSFSFSLEKTYRGIDGNDYLLWDLIAVNTKPTIVAVYKPKVTYGEDFVYTDGKYVKTVYYNSESQKLTSSAEKDIINPDIIYAAEEFGGIEVIYTVNQGMSVDPINANTYEVFIKIAGMEIAGEKFSDKVYLVIDKIRIKVNHVGTPVTKQYDGTENLTTDNIYALQNQFELDGLTDYDKNIYGINYLDLGSISGYYADYKVGKDIDITVNQIRLGADLLTNYYLIEGSVNQVLNDFIIDGIGEIKQKELTINSNSFTFYNIVYKENEEYVLKFTQNGELTFNETLARSDECFIDDTKLVYTLNDYSIGYGKTVSINLSETLDGADKSNYYINNVFYTINIFPYEIVYEMANVGRFTITDYDELCVIPIETKLDGLTVSVINSGSIDYPEFYSIIENKIGRSERLYDFYKYNITTIYGNTINVNNFAGAYVTFTDVKNMSSLYDIGREAKKLDINKTNSTVKIKIGENTSNTFAVLVTKSYFSIWRIILIIGLLLLLLLIIIICIIVYKKIRSKKADAKQKI